MGGKHRGTCVAFWLSDEQIVKLKKLCLATGKRRSEVLRALLDGRPLVDQSFTRMCGMLGKLGGLMKSLLDRGERGKAYRLGEEVLKIAKEIKAGGWRDGADNNRSQDKGPERE